MRHPFVFLAAVLLPAALVAQAAVAQTVVAQTLDIVQQPGYPPRLTPPVYAPNGGNVLERPAPRPQPYIPSAPGYTPSVPAPYQPEMGGIPGAPPVPAMQMPIAEPVKEEPSPPVSTTEMIVRLRLLDKTAAEKKIVDVPIGSIVQYKTLEVVPARCYLDPAHKPKPATAVRLEIYERKANLTPKRLFSGWMYADAPSASHLSHPYFDVAVIECLSKDKAAEGEKEPVKPGGLPVTQTSEKSLEEAPVSED